MRIAHNAAIDFLRRRRRESARSSMESPDGIEDGAPTAEDRLVAATSMRAFMALPANQRSCVVLMDVLGYSLQEIGGILEQTIPSVKAALHRGREALRLAAAGLNENLAPPLAPAERALLARYVDRFNARDFDAIRDMLAAEVRLEVVTRARMSGPAEIRGRYLTNYEQAVDWRFSAGVVDGRPVLLVHDPADPTDAAAYFVALEWAEGRVTAIRDFRYARYVADRALVDPLTDEPTGDPR